MKERPVYHRAGDENIYVQETPERNLWFAVIERALKDYCFFFDRLLTTGTGNLIVYEGLDVEKRQTFNLKAIAELNRLRWFIFNTELLQFNLQYLGEQLYEDGDSAVECIRAEAARQFKLHFVTIEHTNRFPIITNYIRENINVDKMETATVESKLRYKRYRLQVD